MNVMRSLRQCSKHFLQFSLMAAGSNPSKRVFKNCTLRAVSSNIANTAQQPLVNEKSFDEPASSISSKIQEPIDFSAQAERRSLVICILQMDFIFFAEEFTDFHLGPGGYDNAVWTVGDRFSNADFWKNLIQNSQDETHIEMRAMLKHDNVSDSILYSAMAKLCQYLYTRRNLSIRNPKFNYTPYDVLDVLKNVSLNRAEYEALAILFSFEPFEGNGYLFPDDNL